MKRLELLSGDAAATRALAKMKSCFSHEAQELHSLGPFGLNPLKEHSVLAPGGPSIMDSE